MNRTMGFRVSLFLIFSCASCFHWFMTAMTQVSADSCSTRSSSSSSSYSYSSFPSSSSSFSRIPCAYAYSNNLIFCVCLALRLASAKGRNESHLAAPIAQYFPKWKDRHHLCSLMEHSLLDGRSGLGIGHGSRNNQLLHYRLVALSNFIRNEARVATRTTPRGNTHTDSTDKTTGF